ncbi:MAG: PQQ-binding-like beta-propeller repeat protein [Bacteroidales bacterium]|nr:PQQ-binding-like beta-propeller repeat protein [Bacteroidales bacterium]
MRSLLDSTKCNFKLLKYSHQILNYVSLVKKGNVMNNLFYISNRMHRVMICFILCMILLVLSCDEDNQENNEPVQDPRILWTYPIEDSHSCSPAIDNDNTIYISSGTGLLAIHPDGSLKWECILGTNVDTPVIGEDGTIYAQDYMCNLFAIGADGVKKWEFIIEIPFHIGFKTPAIGPDGTIYVVGDSLYAINPDGSKQWAYINNNGNYKPGIVATYSTPTVASDSTIFIALPGEWGFELVALHPDGTVKWISFVQECSFVCGSITIDSEGTLYFPGETGGGEENYFYAYHPDGSLKWIHTITGSRPIRASASIGEDGTIYIGTKASDAKEAEFMALDPADGSVNWTFTAVCTHGVPDDIYISAAVGADGIIYFGAENSFFYALDSEGTVVWTVDFEPVNGGQPGSSSPAIGQDGTIYVTVFGEGALLFALQSTSMGLANSPWPKYRQNNKNTGRGIF